MDPTTIRIPEDLREQIEAEANARNESVSEYVRIILRARWELDLAEADTTSYSGPNTDPNTIEEITEWMEELEARLDEATPTEPDEIEARPTTTPPNPPDTPKRVEAGDGDETAETDGNTVGIDGGPVGGTVEAALDGWRPGRSIDKREAQRDAGKAALEWLCDRGRASAGEFKKYVEPEHSVEGQSPSTWWRKTARTALQRGQDEELCTFDSGHNEWVWME